MTEDAFGVIYDCLVEADCNPSDARIQKVYDSLHPDIKILAEQWGWYDTEVRETVGAYIVRNRGFL